jgi:polysaccharide export outer membrane protein
MSAFLVPVARAASRGLPFGVLLLLGLVLPAGCVRMEMLPTNDAGRIMPYSEPKPFDVSNVPLERNPTQIYRIGPRDTVRVDVRKDPTLSGEYPVTDEGNVLLPNIGPVHVAELTAPEIEEALNRMLERYIREPDVKVGVKEYRSKVIYVVGQVANPGPQVMRADMMTLEEAIFGAGLPTPDAAMQRTLVVRPDLNRPIVYEVDLADIIYKGKLRENILLRPNDRVYVPSRYSANFRDALHEVFGPFEDIERYRSYRNGSQLYLNNSGGGGSGGSSTH